MFEGEIMKLLSASIGGHPDKGAKHDVGLLAVHDSHPMLLEKGVREQDGVQNPVFLVIDACARPCPQLNLIGQL